ncbi:MAG: hypothetical protein V4619_00110 [Bacteroidota bacterium]
MKILFLRLILAVTAAIMISSCQKETQPVKLVNRTINFNLYTEKDFSAENGNIVFNLMIRDGATTLLDSAIATMKIKDIPNKANKLVFAKKLTIGSNVDLRVGFKYTIENVGYSWYFDNFEAGSLHKEVIFSFK